MKLNEKLRSTVYYNLHHKTFSVQQSGRVKAHTDGIVLDNVRFLVAKAGQKKVRETGRKNVHARVSGVYASVMPEHRIRTVPQRLSAYLDNGWRMAFYNPYVTDTFVDQSTGEALHDAYRVMLINVRGRSPLILYRPTK